VAWCWGQNGAGGLGIGSTRQQRSPVRVGAEDDWRAVSAGGLYTCGLREGGSLWCWGNNENGQLGVGTSGPTGEKHVPTRVSGSWREVVTDTGPVENSAFAVADDATLWDWGFQLASIPAQLDARTGWSSLDGRLSALEGGIAHVMGVFPGSAVTTGDPALSFRTLKYGGNAHCGIQADDSLWCWGSDNRFGQLGDGTFTPSPTPVQEYRRARWSSVDMGFYCVYAIDSDAGLYFWGLNDGLHDAFPAGNQSTPQLVDSGAWMAVSTTCTHACGIHTDGTLWCWGGNSNGQLGDGTGGSDRPVRVLP
jgi:alpha-tubulin suppressor-like RCC1 family protein